MNEQEYTQKLNAILTTMGEEQREIEKLTLEFIKTNGTIKNYSDLAQPYGFDKKLIGLAILAAMVEDWLVGKNPYSDKTSRTKKVRKAFNYLIP